MGRPNYAVVNGTTLMGPESLSDMCEQTALRVSYLDARYREMFDQLMEELAGENDSGRTQGLAFSMSAIQQEVKEVFQKVRGTANPHVRKMTCPLCKHQRTFDERAIVCADCAQGDPYEDLRMMEDDNG